MSAPGTELDVPSRHASLLELNADDVRVADVLVPPQLSLSKEPPAASLDDEFIFCQDKNPVGSFVGVLVRLLRRRGIVIGIRWNTGSLRRRGRSRVPARPDNARQLQDLLLRNEFSTAST